MTTQTLATIATVFSLLSVIVAVSFGALAFKLRNLFPDKDSVVSKEKLSQDLHVWGVERDREVQGGFEKLRTELQTLILKMGVDQDKKNDRFIDILKEMRDSIAKAFEKASEAKNDAKDAKHATELGKKDIENLDNKIESLTKDKL
jgi:hypothetical protein